MLRCNDDPLHFGPIVQGLPLTFRIFSVPPIFVLRFLNPKKLKTLGLKPIFSYSELSIMGLIEVLPKIPRIYSLINIVVKDILTIKPDLIISIDAPDFSFRILKTVKRKSPGLCCRKSTNDQRNRFIQIRKTKRNT